MCYSSEKKGFNLSKKKCQQIFNATSRFIIFQVNCHNDEIGLKSAATINGGGLISLWALCAVDTPEGDFFQQKWVLVMFSFWKRHILSKEEAEKHFTFQLPPAPSPLASSPGLVSKEKEKKRRDAFHSLPLILPLSVRLPLLCMKQRGRLKAFTGHSDNEERRSSELY